jgi:hypothetical protein
MKGRDRMPDARVLPFPAAVGEDSDHARLDRILHNEDGKAREHKKLTAMLEEWLDPGSTFWSALENKPRSARSRALLPTGASVVANPPGHMSTGGG